MSDDNTDILRERMSLYQAGLSDGEIARRQDVHPTSVWQWRKNKGLPTTKVLGGIAPSARKKVDRSRISPEQVVKRRELYDAGLSDPAIAAAVGIRSANVLRWRRRENLPAHLPPGRNSRANPNTVCPTSDMKRRVLALLERGLTPGLIARELHGSVSTIERWRGELFAGEPNRQSCSFKQRPVKRTSSGRPYRQMMSERRARALALYADGCNDAQIAADLGVRPHQVWEWRSSLYLPPIKAARRALKPKPKPLASAITPMANPLYAHLYDAIGRGIAADVRDDAISELWLAIEEGSVDVANLVSAAKRFRNRAVSDYANPYGPRSLDEDIGDGDGFRIIDLIRDERSSSWLEDAGATVW